MDGSEEEISREPLGIRCHVWEILKKLILALCAMFPLWKVLCITDSNIPGMDILHYLTSQRIAAVKKSKDSLGDKVLFPCSTLDNVALNEADDNNPVSDTDKRRDNDVDGEDK